MRIWFKSVLLALAFYAVPSIAQSAPAPSTDEAKLKTGCDDQKNPQMCAMYAARLVAGSPTLPRDDVAAARYFSAACDLGGPKGCLEYARMRAAGVVGKGDRAAINLLFFKSCYAPKPLVDGCMLGAAYALEPGTRGLSDELTARDYFAKACDLQNLTGCYLAGSIFHKTGSFGMSGDLAKAVPLLEKACRQPVKDACALLASSKLKMERQALPSAKPQAALPALTKDQQLDCAFAYSISSSFYEKPQSQTMSMPKENRTYYQRSFLIMELDPRRDSIPSELLNKTFNKDVIRDAKTPEFRSKIATMVKTCDRQAGYSPILVR